ncbi:AN1-like Zinc finger [Ancylostoma caninum]|uniref:AN1-like Zinc finger n=1 Tax=Ancylostoma caninum TaxID=29170 RepID=A0A368GJ60_ANCCA|nr:AN1-like Zinc finger [Ancylostoma caninum]
MEPPSDLLEITVNSVMEGVPGAKILVPALCRVSELKSIVSDATDVAPEKQLLLYKDQELKNENAGIRTYGITKDCSITMNVKMSTGSKVARSHNNMNMLFLPMVMQQGSLSSLRNTIKTMTTIRGRPVFRGKVERPMEYTTSWSPAKQMEHELTRNRMKRLLRSRKKAKKTILSDAERSPESVSESPSANSPSTSTKSPVVTPVSTYEPDPSITDKQLKLFFDPPESVEELMVAQAQMTMPPSNMEELLQIKEDRIKAARVTCHFCHRKLQLTEQHIQCLCQEIFCKKHRAPAAHHCSIDYKQTGRSRISRVMVLTITLKFVPANYTCSGKSQDLGRWIS